MTLRSSFIPISDRHQMPLNDPSNFMLTRLSISFHPRKIHPRRRLVDHPSSIRRQYDAGSEFVGRLAAGGAPGLVGGNATGTGTLWRTDLAVHAEAGYFEFAEKEDVFVVLKQHHFEHVRIQLLISLLVVLIIDDVGFDFVDVDSVEGNRRDGSCKVADAMVVVFVVAERPCGKLKPP
eukprot:CAMPEP_0202957618 /NCGR_PEP_ID=MMETSP1396-20130829/1982_1 /ASSEMBLY_ACC=CAM_ASM_000872 /TAXON_ID= /ORGANISM="Pseudokeronopsis sp., Strain Brazil" /LENGTH=177 /DNA_ID=CAMNT_0049675193 /DNA_START=435 /DNA_END=968 /DNA_ORIENTATION=+